MYIHYHFRNSSNDHPNPFKTTSMWNPPLPDNPNLLSYICSVAESIHQTFSHKTHDLNEEEIKFLATHNIHNQKDVIKPADKGGAIIIWSTTDYEKEALSQLNDKKYYEYIQANSTTVISNQTTKITQYVKELYKFGDIDYKTLQYLLPPSPPRTPIFYLLQKFTNLETQADQSYQCVIHQQTSCLPSSISTSNRCAVHYHPTSDTNHFLQTIFNLDTPLPPNTIIATIDVKSLYTNIPHAEGINAVLEALDNKHGCMWPPRKIIH